LAPEAAKAVVSRQAPAVEAVEAAEAVTAVTRSGARHQRRLLPEAGWEETAYREEAAAWVYHLLGWPV